MSLKFYLIDVVSSSQHNIWPRLALIACLIFSFSLPVAHANPSNSNYNYRGILAGYPVCSRTKLAKDVLPADSPRREFDGNLSQFHAYLSCVWWSGGPDMWNHKNLYPFHNSECAVIYGCVHRNSWTEKSALLVAESLDRTCGLNIMDLILARKNHVDGNGQSAPLANICQAKIQDPVDMICPGTREYWREWAEDYGESYQPPPNPCVPGSENFYMPYLIKNKARSFE